MLLSISKTGRGSRPDRTLGTLGRFQDKTESWLVVACTVLGERLGQDRASIGRRSSIPAWPHRGCTQKAHQAGRSPRQKDRQELAGVSRLIQLPAPDQPQSSQQGSEQAEPAAVPSEPDRTQTGMLWFASSVGLSMGVRPYQAVGW